MALDGRTASSRVGADGTKLPVGKALKDKSGVIAGGASASVLVVDGYGQIYDAIRAGACHTLSAAHEFAEWLKHLGTLRPERDAADGPGRGDWA